MEQVLLDFLGEGPFLLGVGETADRLHVFEEQPADVLVREQVVEPVDDLVFDLGPGPERRGVGDLQDPLPVGAGRLHRRMPVVVIDLREVRDHVRGLAAPGDHVVDPAALVDVLAHQVHHEVHGFHPVERRPSLVRSAGRVGGHPPEAELGGQVGERVPGARVVPVPGMPGEHGVHVGEKALPHHVHLAGAALFGRRAVDPNPARVARPLEPVPDRQSGGYRSGPEQVVPTGVAGADAFPLHRFRNGRLAHPGQGVELGEDADHRTLRAPLPDETGRHAGDPGFHGETAGGELFLEEPGALLLLVADLRPVPDAERDLLEVGALGVQELGDDGVGVAVLGGGGHGREERGKQRDERQTGSAHHEGTSRLGGWCR